MTAPAATTGSQLPSSHYLSDQSTNFQEAADSRISLSGPSSLSILTPECCSDEIPMTPTHEIGPSTAFHDDSASTSAFRPSQELSQVHLSAVLSPSSRRPSAAGSLDDLTTMPTSVHGNVSSTSCSRIPLPPRYNAATPGKVRSFQIPRTFREDESTQLLPPEFVRDMVSTSAAVPTSALERHQGCTPRSPCTTQPRQHQVKSVSRFFGLQADTTQFSLTSNPLHLSLIHI